MGPRGTYCTIASLTWEEDTCPKLSALPISAFQRTGIVSRQCATTVELCQQLLLISYNDLSRGAGHLQLDRSHVEILAQWLRMTICIENAIYPADLSSIEVPATKVKERHNVLQCRLHIGDQRQYMRDSHFPCIAGIDATTVHTTRALYHPQVFSQFTAAYSNMELLRPECIQLVEIICV